jgi:hypothetical protein
MSSTISTPSTATTSRTRDPARLLAFARCGAAAARSGLGGVAVGVAVGVGVCRTCPAEFMTAASSTARAAFTVP